MGTSIQPRLLEPGTSGWTASDLEEPEIARQWELGRYEIINGVLKTMPPALFDHGEVVFELLSLVRDHSRRSGVRIRVSTEVDLIVSEDDVLRVDGMAMSGGDIANQHNVLVQSGKASGEVGRVRVAPLLVIESISPGHERHDRVTKRRIYASFGIPNYWIVDRARRSLECLRLADGDYRLDAEGRGESFVEPAAFPGLQIPLRQLWQ